MQQIIAGKNEDGQRLDRLLMKLLPKAGQGFIYKMLRKKNITLNGKKAEGSERVLSGDEIKLFLSDETIAGFGGGSSCKEDVSSPSFSEKAFSEMIVYEDDDIVLINKPAGILSQKAEAEDISINEMLLGYLMKKGDITEVGSRTFRPGICNRLDRNTAGIVAAGKSLNGLRVLSAMFRDRSVEKYYLCIVEGEISQPSRLEGYLCKNEKTNKVTVYKSEMSDGKDYERIITEYRPLKREKGCTLLEVKLITGKSHQIRAHLASIGHPIAGDTKYGNQEFNREMKKRYGISAQLLLAYRLRFPKNCGELDNLAEKEFVIPIPGEFFIRP